MRDSFSIKVDLVLTFQVKIRAAQTLYLLDKTHHKNVLTDYMLNSFLEQLSQLRVPKTLEPGSTELGQVLFTSLFKNSMYRNI